MGRQPTAKWTWYGEAVNAGEVDMAAQVSPAQYDLLLTRQQKVVVFLPLIIFLVMPLIFFVVFTQVGFPKEFLEGAPPFFPWIPLLLFVVIAAIYGWTLGSLPYRISVTHDQKLVFRSLLKERSVRVSDLVSIEPGTLYVQAGISGYVANHREGKIRFPGQFTGMYRLLFELKQANASLAIRGC
jgi:hypothetical protein